VVRRVFVIKDAILTQLQQVLNQQREVQAEVRELHQTSLLTAIHVIEEQQRAREELAKEYARLERRLEALEQQLGLANEKNTQLRLAELDRAA
jgi:hypothetical protein